MRKLIAVVFSLIIFSGCASGNLELQRRTEVGSIMAENIEDWVKTFAEVENCDVHFDGSTVVVSLNLAGEYDDAEIVALKKQIASSIQQAYPYIIHVSVNVSLEAFENFTGEPKTHEERHIQQQLQENRGKQIFENIVPTA